MVVAVLRKFRANKETEGFIMTAKNKLLLNIIKKKIYPLVLSPLGRQCHSCDETVDHLISGCLYLAQSHCKAHLDQAASLVHWQLCKCVGINIIGN